jgi:hypothetical protein
MNHVVKLQEHIHLNDPVVMIAEFQNFLVYMIQQLAVSFKIYCMNVYCHDNGFEVLNREWGEIFNAPFFHV